MQKIVCSVFNDSMERDNRIGKRGKGGRLNCARLEKTGCLLIGSYCRGGNWFSHSRKCSLNKSTLECSKRGLRTLPWGCLTHSFPCLIHNLDTLNDLPVIAGDITLLIARSLSAGLVISCEVGGSFVFPRCSLVPLFGAHPS